MKSASITLLAITWTFALLILGFVLLIELAQAMGQGVGLALWGLRESWRNHKPSGAPK